MASHSLTTRHPGSTSALEGYLADLAARLRGPRVARARVLAEIRDGLTEAIAAHLADGMPPDVATAKAIGEFGDPAAISRAFAEELATASARRTIAAFIFTGPLVGIWWLLLLHPSPWRGGVIALLVAIPALPLTALAITTAAGTFATTGRLIRWLPETTGARAVAAATTVAALCLAGDFTVLGVLVGHLATAWHGPAVLIAAAVTASVVRIAAATAVIRSTRALRERLGSR